MAWLCPSHSRWLALVTRKLEDWTVAIRSWTLVAWLGLGVGLLLGMRWAYDVLGWGGGYWGWDPVENAGLLPWFTATALVHGPSCRGKQGFRVWNVLLAVFSFALNLLFGTFATRSMVQSVHAYTQSNLGPYFLSTIAVTLVSSFGLLLSRRKALGSPATLETLLSRDRMFLTLVVLSLLAFSVLHRQCSADDHQALTARRFEAGPAWFDRVTGPQFALLVLLIGICPLLGRAATALVRLGHG